MNTTSLLIITSHTHCGGSSPPPNSLSDLTFKAWVSRRNSLTTSARASGFTPFSIKDTSTLNVFLSRPQFRSWDISNKTNHRLEVFLRTSWALDMDYMREWISDLLSSVSLASWCCLAVKVAILEDALKYILNIVSSWLVIRVVREFDMSGLNELCFVHSQLSHKSYHQFQNYRHWAVQ